METKEPTEAEVKAQQMKADVKAVCDYILDSDDECENFLEDLNENGAFALSEEELDVLLEEDEDQGLLHKECMHPEQTNIYAVAYRLEWNLSQEV